MTDEKEERCSACQQLIARYKKKAEGQGWELYLGDSLKLIKNIIPSGTFDAVITDPPYGSGGDSIRDRLRSTKNKYVSSDALYSRALPDIDGDSLHPAKWKSNMDAFLKQAYRVLKPEGVFICFIDWRNIGEMISILNESNLRLRGVVVWDKRNGRPYRGGFRMQTEYILWGGRGGLPREDFYGPGIISEQTIQGGKLHITQKPISLMEQLIEICPPGGKILDPFAGSSTTGVAAVKSGRRFVGFESVPEYFDISVKRMQEL